VAHLLVLLRHHNADRLEYPPVIKAVTLHRPWPYAIFHLGKDVENRTWHPPGALIGQRIAIHAGKTWDQAGLEFIRRLGYDCPDDGTEHPLGIIGTVRLTGTMEPVRTTRKHQALFSKWYMGRVGWMIADPRKLAAPLTVSGKQRLWNVPPQLARKILEG